jgi:hypothetical protein
MRKNKFFDVFLRNPALLSFSKQRDDEESPINSMKVENNILKMSFMLSDSVGVIPKSIQVFIDKEEKEFSVDKIFSALSLKIEKLQPGMYPLRVVAANKN